jgi:hypothetical protein
MDVGADACQERVSVSVRIRPLNARERESEEVWRAAREPGHIHLVDPKDGKEAPGSLFAYDNVFPPAATTLDVFDSVGRRLALSAVEGFNSTIFAYGQVRQRAACGGPGARCGAARPTGCWVQGGGGCWLLPRARAHPLYTRLFTTVRTHSCVLVLQTASGKTFTMQGTDKNPGILRLSIDEIFSKVAKVGGWSWSLACGPLPHAPPSRQRTARCDR